MKPKILIVDLEISTTHVRTWGIHDQNISIDAIIKPWRVLCWAAKWKGEKKIHTANSFHKKSDKTCIKKLAKMWNQADIIIYHNGDSADKGWLWARLAAHRIKAPKHPRVIDTKKEAKKHFRFLSNSLEHLAEYLGVPFKKDKHPEYPGLSLWIAVEEGVRRACKIMQKYNNNDILVLDLVYDRLQPYIMPVNFAVFNKGKPTCSCGSNDLKKDGVKYTNAGAYQRLQCRKCGNASLRMALNQIPAKKRKKMPRVS